MIPKGAAKSISEKKKKPQEDLRKISLRTRHKADEKQA